MANKQPTATKRNLAEDMRICEVATPGNWFVMHDTDITVEDPPGSGYTDSIGYASSVIDAQFIAEARTGWPHAIQRAIEAEDLADHLRAEIAYLSAFQSELLRQLGKQRAYTYFLRECLRNGVQIPYDYNFSAFKEAYGGGETQDYEI
ncbi:hypothetical protein [Paenibacillus sp. YN15]|uniref:hypothetical protein n=1 Tax=Paenibacillus sp. YN15 TaxID=1742774 RepID=UPI000DCDBB3F|nr:hypothetical protein [Paenibacillus sp. YN15]RAU96790.1 hypothetical protein DQG13_19720 [Paenibacillus sp. YN15]